MTVTLTEKDQHLSVLIAIASGTLFARVGAY